MATKKASSDDAFDIGSADVGAMPPLDVAEPRSSDPDETKPEQKRPEAPHAAEGFTPETQKASSGTLALVTFLRLKWPPKKQDQAAGFRFFAKKKGYVRMSREAWEEALKNFDSGNA